MIRHDPNRLDIHLIDPEIKNLINVLNVNGYITTGSCAGHKGEKPFERGNISFNRILYNTEQIRVKQIFESFGCKRIKFNNEMDTTKYIRPVTRKVIMGYPHTDVSFSPMGEPWKSWIKKRPAEAWRKYYE